MAKTTRHGGASNKAVAPIVTRPQSLRPEVLHTVPAPPPGLAGLEDVPSEYGEFSLEELRGELRGRFLPSSGNKPELVARLEAADAYARDPIMGSGTGNPQGINAE